MRQRNRGTNLCVSEPVAMCDRKRNVVDGRNDDTVSLRRGRIQKGARLFPIGARRNAAPALGPTIFLAPPTTPKTTSRTCLSNSAEPLSSLLTENSADSLIIDDLRIDCQSRICSQKTTPGGIGLRSGRSRLPCWPHATVLWHGCYNRAVGAPRFDVLAHSCRYHRVPTRGCGLGRYPS